MNIFFPSLFFSLILVCQSGCDIGWVLRVANPYLCSFLQTVTNDTKEAIAQIYTAAVNLTKEELNNKLNEWAAKQGGELEEGLRKYLAEEADYWNRRYETLMRRITESNATAEAKRELIDIVNFEQDMDIKFNEYEAKLNAIQSKYNKDVEEEAKKIWDAIDTPEVR
ncbi:hypothetical protein Tcan_13804 [Toxocara canis]|uniref:DUF148 domain-containing protein n=1 Tax=Toxocara canis TaxID=6265 RepID=A0A0B2VPA5_TOXCA|nr:hypothetical protein Tcan_13804 [Toxocara canis]